MEKFNVGILGGGPGGYVCALRAAQLGLSVVLAEGERLGGTCLNRGCIPTKALVKSAELWREIGRSEEFGLAVGERRLDFARVMERKDKVVDTLVNGVEQLMKAGKIKVVKGWGAVREPGFLEVEGDEAQLEKVRAQLGAEQTAGENTGSVRIPVQNIVLATGSLPARIPVPGTDLPGVVTSDEILSETELPASLVVIGGGVIGLEMASIYRAFGVKVAVVEMLPSLLATIDEEIPKRLTPLLKRSGLEILTKTAVKGIRREKERLFVLVEGAKGERELEAERVLIATGRKPNLRGINVEGLGLETERGALRVNRKMETNVPHVYAIGDAVGGIMLAHVASTEGIVAAEQIGGLPSEMDYRAIPSAIFTYPEIATAGASEQELKERGMAYKVSKFPFSANGKALALGEPVGLVKILADEQGVILGGAIMGPQASSLIQELTLAIQEGLSADQVARTVHAHPTLPEAVMEAAHGVLGKALHLA
ncbi:dihydrolipoyl dehydrogenase [Peptococcaceae bacterium CEB3]|nr:dihydrolipoyl dehydrogenase [Peptococcaceae bacterium CEB3]